MSGVDDFGARLSAAIRRRRALIGRGESDAWRVLGGVGDGVEGVYLDRYGAGAVLSIHEGRAPAWLDPVRAAGVALEGLGEFGVTAVYLKPFARDRSRLGGVHPGILSDPTPAAGSALAEWFLVREHGWSLEVRLYDGYSTGLFGDQRDNRRHLAVLMGTRAREGRSARVLNTFCYTGAFSVACALGHPGVEVASVDVSGKYLDWARRNFTHNTLDPGRDGYRFARMDTFEFIAYARRKGMLFDLVILDPPSFSAGKRARGVRTWSATEHYAELASEASGLLDPRGAGLLFASTNTLELCRGGGAGLDRHLSAGLGSRARRLELPRVPEDYAVERGRLEARLLKL